MLLDINMPVMDDLVGASVGSGKVRAIIVSAYGDMPNIRTAMNVARSASFDRSMVDLQATIRKALDEIAKLRD
jgi:hypothetical protein